MPAEKMWEVMTYFLERVVPVADRFFASVGEYLHGERPPCDTDRLFVVLKGPRRGQPLSVNHESHLYAFHSMSRSSGARFRTRPKGRNVY